MKKYLMGVDGGGTKTDVLLCTLEGQIVVKASGGSSSMSGQLPEKAMGELRNTICAAFSAAGIDASHVAGYYAGVSGAGLPKHQALYRSFFAELMPGITGDAGSDAVNALSAGIAMHDGTIAIAGTGSSVHFRADGRFTRIGGWGYILGDEGSGFDLGRRALAATLRAVDQRCGPTLLRTLCEEQMGRSLDDWIYWLYHQDYKTEIAAYAPLLLQAAQQGDAIALEELNKATEDMACAIYTAVKRGGSPSVVMGGSLWKNALYREMVKQHSGDMVEFIHAKCPPVCGAVVIAADLVSDADTDTLLDTMITQYSKG